MLIWYYLTSIIIAAILVMIGQWVWAILPLVCMIVISTGTIQQHHNSQSLQQFATDNVMLLSWIVLIIGTSWMAYLGGYNIIVSMICISLITIGVYCISLALRYDDGIIVGHQASILSFAAVLFVVVVTLSQEYIYLQQYVGIFSVYVIVVGIVLMLYRMCSHSFGWSLPQHFRDETIVIGFIFIPVSIVSTLCIPYPLRGSLILLLLYVGYGRGLMQLKLHHYPIANKEQLTLDLVLKGYKTSDVSSLTRRSWINDTITTISHIHSPARSIIEHTPDILMLISYCCLFGYVLQGGILLSDFVIYCLTFALYASLGYVYQRSGNLFTIDTIAMSFVIGYLSIMICMITVFSGDLIGGSVVGVLRIVANALLVTQYRSLNLQSYIGPQHVQRWVWANTASAFILVVLLIQLPIDGVMIIPIILIVSAVLGITIAQSYSTLRTIKK